MTTRQKIIAGFVIMVLLIGSIAALGYIDLEKSSNAFNTYRRYARINVAISDMANALTRSSQYTANYVISPSQELVRNVNEASDTFLKICASSEAETQIPERKKTFQGLAASGKRMKDIQNTIIRDVDQLRQAYEDVRGNYNAMDAALIKMTDQAAGVDNVKVLYEITQARQKFGHVLSSLARLVASGNEADAKRASERVGGMKENFEALGAGLTTSEGRAIFKTLVDAHARVEKATAAMVGAGKSYREHYAEMSALMAKGLSEIDAFNKASDESTQAVGVATLEANAAAQNQMVIISVAGVVIGVLLATFIILGLMRVLRELAGFASATARGDFSYQVKTKERGEIGTMVSAMKAIPEALQGILSEYRELETDIEKGKLAAEGNAGKFQGEFATLIRGTNNIMARFRMVLESLPSPVVVLGGDLKATYLNTVARSLAGEDYQGKTCFQLFARDDFETKGCGLTTAMQTKRPASGETVAHPQGRTMDVSYTAIPMFDSKGEIASVLQLITDLTAIKGQQRTMMDVAHRASEISNRVAAASEELSAQVEQVSRGAEVQRERVESTASAMTEMNATVLEVARSAGEASEQSEGTRSKAEEGAKLVGDVVRAINAVNAVGQNLQVNMQELGKQAENIGNVMNVISDVADQTNLLALNAAIEAARAGEAGRGFAVVADEVRKLAERTMEATREVGTCIDAVQNSARINIDEVGKAVASVAEANGLANSSGTALSEIVNLAAASSAVVASIATAAEQQSSTSDEISRSIDEINTIVGETTEGMVQSSSAVQELSRMAQELNRVMEELK